MKAIGIASSLASPAEVEQFVSEQRYVCCNCWLAHAEPQRNELHVAKWRLYMQRMQGGCEFVGCPFAGLDGTILLLQLHHHADYVCTQETNKKLKDSAVTLAAFQLYLDSHFLVVRCEMCHRLEHPEKMVLAFGKQEE